MTTSTLRGALASTPEGLDVTVPTRLQLDTGWEWTASVIGTSRLQFPGASIWT